MRLPGALKSVGLIALTLGLASGCGNDRMGPDTTPPADVTDLSATPAYGTSVILTWTARGNTGRRGKASQYDIRYSTLPDTGSTWWEDASPVPNPPLPAAAGQRESLLVSGLTRMTEYYFAIRVADGVPNWSETSNVASVDALCWVESLEDVLDNIELAYNQRDYESYEPLIRDGFTFWFNDNDVHNYPDIPREGYWGKSEELECTWNMMDPDYVPDDPLCKIDDMRLYLEPPSTLIPTRPESDPPPPYGTLEGYVTLDLRMEVGSGSTTFLVRSRPLFYFTPDTTATPNTWTLWRITDDDVYDYQATAASPAELAVGWTSWGAVKSLYR